MKNAPRAAHAKWLMKEACQSFVIAKKNANCRVREPNGERALCVSYVQERIKSLRANGRFIEGV